MPKLKALNLFSIILAFVLIFSIIGCSSGNSAEGEAPAETATEKPTEDTKAPAEEPAEEVIDMQGKPIKIAAWWSADPRAVAEADRDAFAQKSIEVIEQVEKKYNTKIEFVTLDYNQFVEQFTTTSLAGEPIADIVRLELFWMFPKLVKDGFVAPLEDYIAIDQAKVPAWMIEGGTYEGKQYGLVESSPSGFGVWYNKTLFQKLGLEDPYQLQQKGEWTWEKFVEIAKNATKDSDGDGKVDTVGLSAGARDLFNMFVYTNNASVDVAEDGTPKFSLDSPNAMEAAQAFYDLYNTHKVVDTAGEQFVNGKVAMTIHFTWEIGNYKQNMTDELGFVFFPKGPKAEKYTTHTPFGNMWAVSKMSKNAEVAAKVLDEMTLWRTVYPDVQDMVNESQQATYPSAEIVDTVRQMGKNVEYINYTVYPEATAILDEATKNMAEGKETPATAIEKIKPLLESSMKQILE
ncbi:extracellular solute-binding protein [Paenibacillus alkaliterrae]|uniref:ABC transporter substrate-binding protein n=1 Tax=Paenibacillus alkaliterrae TaxID=320909 RepID=UPI001F15BE45|nr:extracellular solute-binding protein [Paenibacillus alkaliterrae]MCF2939249.1 extracellular solute-binding protein [Paenibacillus alkaliterrae]